MPRLDPKAFRVTASVSITAPLADSSAQPSQNASLCDSHTKHRSMFNLKEVQERQKHGFELALAP